MKRLLDDRLVIVAVLALGVSFSAVAYLLLDRDREVRRGT